MDPRALFRERVGALGRGTGRVPVCVDHIQPEHDDDGVHRRHLRRRLKGLAVRRTSSRGGTVLPAPPLGVFIDLAWLASTPKGKSSAAGAAGVLAGQLRRIDTSTSEVGGTPTTRGIFLLHRRLTDSIGTVTVS